MKYHGVEIEFEGYPDPPEKPPSHNRKEPRYYWINAACGRWMIRTGRPMMEWLWDDDLETRHEDEKSSPPAEGYTGELGRQPKP